MLYIAIKYPSSSFHNLSSGHPFVQFFSIFHIMGTLFQQFSKWYFQLNLSDWVISKWKPHKGEKQSQTKTKTYKESTMVIWVNSIS